MIFIAIEDLGYGCLGAQSTVWTVCQSERVCTPRKAGSSTMIKHEMIMLQIWEKLTEIGNQLNNKHNCNYVDLCCTCSIFFFFFDATAAVAGTGQRDEDMPDVRQLLHSSVHAQWEDSTVWDHSYAKSGIQKPGTD